MDTRLKDIIDKKIKEYETNNGGTEGLGLFISQQVFGSK